MSGGTSFASVLRCLAMLVFMPATVSAQGFLDQFSYEGLRLTAIGADVGVVHTDRLERTASGALRVDYGMIAPRVRTLVSLSYFRSEFNSDEIARFEERLRAIVDDPTDDFTINVGVVNWSNVALDVDLQYVIVPGGRVAPFIGLGAGVHVRNASGQAIDDTFVEDALDTIEAGLNGTAGIDAGLSRDLWLTAEVRGSLTSGLKAVSLRAGLMYRFPGREAR